MLLDSEGHIKVTDFGLAKHGMNDEARTNSFIGTMEVTPSYITSVGCTVGVQIAWHLPCLCRHWLFYTHILCAVHGAGDCGRKRSWQGCGLVEHRHSAV